MHQQCMGYCVWWLLGEYRCYCGVSTAGVLDSRSVASICFWRIGMHLLLVFIMQQMQLPSSLLALVLVLAQSSWMMLAAEVEKVSSLTAQRVSMFHAPISTGELEWDVKVVEVYISFYDSYHDIKYTDCSQCYWQLYLWRCSSGGRLQSVWGKSGGVHQWPVGDCVWWLLEWIWCYCDL